MLPPITKQEFQEAQIEILRLQLDAARAVIREFVYPSAVMTPAQYQAWEQWIAWEEVNGRE